MPHGTPPAEGERRAISGYSAQYRTAALLTLDGLRDGSLQWVRVGDPDAGTLDDFQIGRGDRVDAYQIKYSATSGNLTFRRLAQLLPDLASGWQSITTAHRDETVFAHLFTTQRASTHGPVAPLGDPPPRPRHFAGFLEQVWRPVNRGEFRRTSQIPSAWRTAWRTLQQASSLNVSTFLDFARHFTIDLAQPIADGEPDDPALDPSLRSDLQDLLWILEDAVRTRQIHLTRNDVLAKLGWSDRVEFRSSHDFPIDERFYRRNEGSADELMAAVNALPGGYLALIGTPGSGKSSLLTDLLRYRNDLVARYYAFVPGGADIRATRARAAPFLHDLVLSIDRAGFPVGQTLNNSDPDTLARRLQRQLEALGAASLAEGKKALILIDGLDHVERGLPTNPADSLLQYLPVQPPDGVLIVLGSQTVQPAPEWVRTAVAQPGRTVEIRPLPRATVDEIAEAGAIHERPLKDLLWSRGAGHPLLTAYLVQGLVDTSHTERRAWLEGLGGLDGEIEALYRHYWSSIENEDALVELLAMIARWRGPIDLEWFAEHGHDVAVRTVRRLAGYFFRREAADRWYFFHESFRLFLIEQTGSADERADARYHRMLADMCAATPPAQSASWEQLHHLILAGARAQVQALATPQFFRAQTEALRAPSAIAADIRAALVSIAEARDVLGLVNLVLAARENSARSFELEWSQSLPLLLIRLGDVRSAVEHLRSGFELRDRKDIVLEASISLDIKGERAEAERLFELAEPLDLLTGEPEHYGRMNLQHDVLEAWAAAAPRFREASKVVEQIVAMPVSSFELRSMRADEQESAAPAWRARLLLTAARTFDALEDADGVGLAIAALDQNDEFQCSLRLLLEVESGRDADGQPVEATIASLREAEPTDYRDFARVTAAEYLLRVGERDLAHAWSIAVPQPPAERDYGIGDERFMPHVLRFRLNRVLAIVGEVREPAEIIPDPDNARDYGATVGARDVISVAQLSGRIVTGPDVPITAVTEVLDGIFDHVDASNRNWRTWSGYLRAVPELLALLVESAARHSPDALEDVRRRLAERWSTTRLTHRDEMRKVLLVMAEAGIDPGWIRDQMRALDAAPLADSDVGTQINECFEQAAAWLELGDEERARAAMHRGVRASFGVGARKDTQLDDWIELMKPQLTETSTDANDRIIWLARCLAGLEATTEGDAGRYAAKTLLAAVASSHPAETVRLVRWLPTVNVLGTEEALAAALDGMAAAGDGLAWRVLQDCLVPMARTEYPQVVEALARTTPSEELGDRLTALADRVAVEGLASTRLGWRGSIVKALEQHQLVLDDAGLTDADLTASERAPESMRNHTTPTEKRFDDVSSAAELLSRVEPTNIDDYEWDEVVERLVDSLTAEHAEQIFHAFANTRRGSLIGARLSGRLDQLGRRQAAADVARRAAEGGTPSGWVVWSDGGSRVRPLQALASVAREEAQALLWQLLAQDAPSDRLYIGELSRQLPDLLDLLDVSDEQRDAIASSVANYCGALLTDLILPPADDIGELRGVGDVEAGLAALLVDHITGNSPDSIPASRACVTLVAEGHEAVSRRLIVWGSSSAQLASLLIADASGRLGTPQPDLVEYVTAVATTEQDPYLRSLAQEVAQNLGVDNIDADALPNPATHSALDPVRLTRRPSARPVEIPAAAHGENTHPSTDQWLALIDTALEDAPDRTGGLHVLAEETTLRRLAWDLPGEHRYQVIGPRGLAAWTDGVVIVDGLSADDYADFSPDGEGHAKLIVQSHHATARLNWLAVNPEIARGLGWVPSDRLFGWDGSDGAPMVHSVWWQDGSLRQSPPSFEDEVGEGWLVLATAAALTQLKARYEPLGLVAVIARWTRDTGITELSAGKDVGVT
jgi:hypothetical protein